MYLYTEDKSDYRSLPVVRGIQRTCGTTIFKVDIDGSGAEDLTDAVIALKLSAGAMDPATLRPITA